MVFFTKYGVLYPGSSVFCIDTHAIRELTNVSMSVAFVVISLAVGEYGFLSFSELNYRNFTANITIPAMPGYGFMEMMIQMNACVS